MRRLLFCLNLLIPFCITAQEVTPAKKKEPKGTFYAGAGFHRVYGCTDTQWRVAPIYFFE